MGQKGTFFFWGSFLWNSRHWCNGYIQQTGQNLFSTNHNISWAIVPNRCQTFHKGVENINTNCVTSIHIRLARDHLNGHPTSRYTVRAIMSGTSIIVPVSFLKDIMCPCFPWNKTSGNFLNLFSLSLRCLCLLREGWTSSIVGKGAW